MTPAIFGLIKNLALPAPAVFAFLLRPLEYTVLAFDIPGTGSCKKKKIEGKIPAIEYVLKTNEERKQNCSIATSILSKLRNTFANRSGLKIQPHDFIVSQNKHRIFDIFHDADSRVIAEESKKKKKKKKDGRGQNTNNRCNGTGSFALAN